MTRLDRSCRMNDCEKVVHARELCMMHYRRWRVHGDPALSWVMRDKVCSIEGCDGKMDARTYCNKHWQAWRKHGDPLYKAPTRDVPHGTLTGYGHYRCRCDDCRQAQATSNRRALLRQFGLTPESYDRMFQEQGGLCAICRLEGSGQLSGRLMAVDHCHATGKVRGLLCQRCNHAIGLLHDDPDRAMALAAYLLQQSDVLGEMSR